MDSAMNVFPFNHKKLDSDGTIHMNTINLKEGGFFDDKFPFDCVVIIQDLLPKN